MVLRKKDVARELFPIFPPYCYEYGSPMAMILSRNQGRLFEDTWLTNSDSAWWCSLGPYKSFHVLAILDAGVGLRRLGKKPISRLVE